MQGTTINDGQQLQATRQSNGSGIPALNIDGVSFAIDPVQVGDEHCHPATGDAGIAIQAPATSADPGVDEDEDDDPGTQADPLIDGTTLNASSTSSAWIWLGLL